jgi:hypothetical protein
MGVKYIEGIVYALEDGEMPLAKIKRDLRSALAFYL